MIRLGHLVLRHPGVRQLYQCRFGAMVVDEVQDLSMAQLELALAIGPDRAVFAGDPTQGIYGFAGAEPAKVLAAIRALSPAEYQLCESYRSSPPVLRVVSALGVELGGSSIATATPGEWGDRGTFRMLRSRHARDEAQAVGHIVVEWLDAFPDQSLAVMARSKNRRSFVDEVMRDRGIPSEIWDFPAHAPQIAGLLSHHLALAVLAGADAVQELYNRCVSEIPNDDLDMLDELQEAINAIDELVRSGYGLSEVVGGIRLASDADAPVGAGLHLLNGHVGKGQQFDRVIVVGLEEAILPSYQAMIAEDRGDGSKIIDELAVLHVMVSRAREDLVVCTARVVPKWNGQDLERTPSRFLRLIEHLTHGDSGE